MMKEANDFIKKLTMKKGKTFSESIGIDLECAKVIFLDLFLYTHGIAVLTAKKLTLDRYSAEKMLKNILTAFIRQEKSDWNLSI